MSFAFWDDSYNWDDEDANESWLEFKKPKPSVNDHDSGSDSDDDDDDDDSDDEDDEVSVGWRRQERKICDDDEVKKKDPEDDNEHLQNKTVVRVTNLYDPTIVQACRPLLRYKPLIVNESRACFVAAPVAAQQPKKKAPSPEKPVQRSRKEADIETLQWIDSWKGEPMSP